MAASLQNRIEDYIGPRHSDMELTDWVTALSQWLTASAKELFDIIREMTLKKVAPATMSSATTGTSLAGKRVFGVDIAGYPAREVPALEWAKVINPNSIHYARSTDPVFYIKEGKLYVMKDGDLTDGGNIHYISAPEVTYDLTTVPYFPTEYEPLVVLGAAIRGKMRQIVDTRSTLPSLLDLSSVTVPTAPAEPSFSYTDALAAGIDAQTVTFTGIAPTYTDGIVDTELGELATLIDTEEDEELARAKVSQIQAIISDELNGFNEEQIEYQAKLQADMQNAQQAQRAIETAAQLEVDVDKTNKLQVLQMEIKEYESELQRYSSSVQAYSSDVTKFVQVYSNKIQGVSADHGLMMQELQGLQGLYQQELQLLMGGQQSGG